MLCEVSAAMTSTRSTEAAGAADASDDHATAASAAHSNSFPARIIGLSVLAPGKCRGSSARLQGPPLCCHARAEWWYGWTSCGAGGAYVRICVEHHAQAAGG